MIDRGMDSNGSMDQDRLGMSNNRSMDKSMLSVDRGRSVVGNSLIADISNISTVGISNVVVDHLGPAVRKSHSVGSTGGVAVSLLILTKLGSTVVISHAILVGIDSRLVIGGLRSVARGSGHAKGSTEQGGESNNSLKCNIYIYICSPI